MSTRVLVEGHSISGTAVLPRNYSYPAAKLPYAWTEQNRTNLHFPASIVLFLQDNSSPLPSEAPLDCSKYWLVLLNYRAVVPLKQHVLHFLNPAETRMAFSVLLWRRQWIAWPTSSVPMYLIWSYKTWQMENWERRIFSLMKTASWSTVRTSPSVRLQSNAGRCLKGNAPISPMCWGLVSF